MTANTHHTKLKGDIAVAAVILDLTKKGYIISEPMSENAPYDLICDTGEKLLRIQVKYREDETIPYKNSWSDKNGHHSKKIDILKIDYFALVNKDLLVCYPLASMLGNTIRFKTPENYYNKYHFYKDYLDFKTEVQPTHQIYKNKNTKEIVLNITKDMVLDIIKISYYKSDAYRKLNIPPQIFNKLLNDFNIEFSEHCLEKIKQEKTKKTKNTIDIKEIELRLKNKETLQSISIELNITSDYLSSLLTKEGIYTSEMPEQQEILHPKKIEWPSVEDMQRLVWEKSTVMLSKELGVSDVAIAKYCKKHNISKPARGYWAKLYAEEIEKKTSSTYTS